MADNLAGAHAAGVHRDDLVVEPRKATLVSGDQLRVEAGLAVARHRQLDPASVGKDRLLAVAISPIARLFAGQLRPQLCPQRTDPGHPATGQVLFAVDDFQPDQPGQAALHDLRGRPQHDDLSQFPTTPDPRGHTQAVRDRRQSAGTPSAPDHRVGAGSCRSDRTLLPAAPGLRRGRPYAPEHNPDEFLNNDLKQAMARRRTPRDKAALKSGLTSYMRSLQRCPAKVRAFFQAPSVQYAA